MMMMLLMGLVLLLVLVLLMVLVVVYFEFLSWLEVSILRIIPPRLVVLLNCYVFVWVVGVLAMPRVPAAAISTLPQRSPAASDSTDCVA